MSEERHTTAVGADSDDEFYFHNFEIPSEIAENLTKKAKKEYCKELTQLKLAKMKVKRSRLELVSLN